jgi:glycosyltransferase involved in cell wall biosynthesis
VLSNGVDLDNYRRPDRIKKEPDTIIFSGKMSYHANITMAAYLVDEIMPRVWQERPNVRVVIVGKDPSSAIRRFAENPKITVTGTVEDIRPFLWKASVAVVPLIYGAGIQNKILEAMAAGTPVIGTSRTLPALCAVAGKDLLVADTPEAFAAQILLLMANQNLYNEIGHNGLAYVAKYHDWNSIAGQLVEIYQQTANQKRGSQK